MLACAIILWQRALNDHFALVDTVSFVNSSQVMHYFEHRVDDNCYPPLVLLHGAGGQHVHWPPQIRRLKALRVVAPDLPGHGQSAGSGCSTVEAYTEEAIQLLDQLEIMQAVIGGHSMGGAIAQQIALAYPERVSGLVLVSTGAKLRVEPMSLGNVLTDIDTVIDFVTTYAYGPVASDKLKQLGRAALQMNSAETLYGDYLACDAFDVMGRLEFITAPVLIAAGTNDHMTPLKFSTYLDEQLPDSELHIVEGAGHMLPVEFPDKLARIIFDWIERRFA